MASERPNGFVKAIGFTLPWETGKDKNGNLRADGGLVVDAGGVTKYGISDRGDGVVDGKYDGILIKDLTVDKAIDLYKRHYWDVYVSLRPTSANLDSLPISLAVSVFDSGVNCGPGRAIVWLGAALQQKSPAKAVIDQRVAFYTDKASRNPSYPLKGLLARTNDLRKYCDILERDDQQSFNVLESILGRKI